MRTIKEQEKRHAVGFDWMMERMKAALRQLSWIDQSFGRAWDVTRMLGTRRYVEPCVYCHGNEYETLCPSADLGNYSFFVLNGATEVDHTYNTMESDFALVVWVDLRRCFGGDENRRDTENLKLELLETLKNVTFGSGRHIVLDSVEEDASAVWRGWTFEEADNQYMMQPYAGFRVNGTMYGTMCM